jgi:hypothetical protein
LAGQPHCDSQPARVGWSILPDGQIMNNTANLCLDDPGDSTVNGTQLVLEDCYGEAGEIWAVG